MHVDTWTCPLKHLLSGSVLWTASLDETWTCIGPLSLLVPWFLWKGSDICRLGPMSAEQCRWLLSTNTTKENVIWRIQTLMYFSVSSECGSIYTTCLRLWQNISCERGEGALKLGPAFPTEKVFLPMTFY